MVKVAELQGGKPAALHRRKRQVMAALREYLVSRGIYSSSDVFDE
jgi:hypothetical protein